MPAAPRSVPAAAITHIARWVGSRLYIPTGGDALSCSTRAVSLVPIAVAAGAFPSNRNAMPKEAATAWRTRGRGDEGSDRQEQRDELARLPGAHPQWDRKRAKERRATPSLQVRDLYPADQGRGTPPHGTAGAAAMAVAFARPCQRSPSPAAARRWRCRAGLGPARRQVASGDACPGFADRAGVRAGFHERFQRAHLRAGVPPCGHRGDPLGDLRPGRCANPRRPRQGP